MHVTYYLSKHTKLFALSTLILLAIYKVDTHAHHLSAALYNSETDASISGVISKVEWRNPHVYFYLEQVTDNENLVTWEIESPPPATLRRAGWSPQTLTIGAQVTVVGKSGRDPSRKVFLFESLVMEDDVVIGLESSLASLPQQDAAIEERATTLNGTWGTNFSMEANLQLILSSNLDLTEKGRSAIESYVDETDNPGLDCIPATPPSVMLVPDIKSIAVMDDFVLIRAEHEAIERIVYLNVDSHDGAVISVHGHSIGRWDAGKLVIDTTHFTPHRQGNAAGLPSGVGKHLIEELALNDDGSRLIYSYKLEDPEYLATPVTDEIEWAYRPDFEYLELPCDIEIARRFAQ